MKSFIPSNLDEVHNVERDLEMIGEGQTEQVIYLCFKVGLKQIAVLFSCII